MTLGYLDTFYNDSTIPNSRVFVNGSNQYLVEKSYFKGAPNPTYIPHSKWSHSPGTTQGLHDLLYNYGYYLWSGPDGTPVLGGHLKHTFEDYRDQFIPTVVRDYYYPVVGSFFNTHQKPRELISNGVPTIIVMTSYDSSIDSDKWHDVVAYGYKGDKFLAHFGWWARTPGSSDDATITSAAEVIINSATIQSYFGIGYSGPHTHSNNVIVQGTNNTICGCGKVYVPNPPGGGNPPPIFINGDFT
jgi:hypothetical protein